MVVGLTGPVVMIVFAFCHVFSSAAVRPYGTQESPVFVHQGAGWASY
jgi:hypothetical protein